MEDLRRLSKALYVGLCKEVGSPTRVAIRRDMRDLVEMVDANTKIGFRLSMRGSSSEGMRILGSDRDYMMWVTDHKVICYITQSQLYKDDVTLLLMDNSDVRPGSTLLKLISPTNNKYVMSASINMNDGIYVSSTLYRETTLTLMRPNSTAHGPCAKNVDGQMEYDFAHSFSCDHWPLIALPWVERCQKTRWPPKNLSQILAQGCHMVPLGSKDSPLEDCEWRISFSMAEQQLTYALNHCQFLCYGLLKLFLKQVIEKRVENQDLLCSYFLKTAVFWEVQESGNLWSCDNMLLTFWNCFKRLLKWVHTGHCPNFFIPLNNMFLGKIEGATQTRLFTELYALYDKGFASLLECPTISLYIINTIENPLLPIITDENAIVSEIEIDWELFRELMKASTDIRIITASRFRICLRYLSQMQEAIRIVSSQFQAMALQNISGAVLQNVAFHLLDTHVRKKVDNKTRYIVDKTSCRMLKLSVKYGNITDLLYIAMYYYKTLRYETAMYYVNMAKGKLAQPYIMSNKANEHQYIDGVGGLSYPTKRREAMAMLVRVPNKSIYYVEEIKFENEINLKIGEQQLLITPFVMANFLSVLCNRGYVEKQREATNVLQTLLKEDDGFYAPFALRDLSWQMLGICQEICGDFSGAINSYKKSLEQRPFHSIQEATKARIHKLQIKLNIKP